MSFIYEVENYEKLQFLDILVTRDDKDFTTNVYRKLTFSGLYINFHSFFYQNPITGLLLTYSLCSDWSKIHTKIIKLRNIMIKNNFPSKFIDRCIKLFFDKLFSSKKRIVLTVHRKIMNITLPFMGKYSLKIRGNLTKLTKTYYPCCKIQVMFNSGKRLGSFFSFKDRVSLNRVPLNVRSLLLYRFTYSRCNSAYLGNANYLVRMFEHLGISLSTG